ncbi:hypothetical protein [Microvirga mediterraneensis]|uniref:Uncharacterized protein n=1 Tax=Microvirga mediterraneensis TaxID=2754695 RepID=A0A838BRB7_9HYPH|nr:hypothetical protein [Microvirga mediterraneensis]MBA1157473.1 hypothetical protein [Microvirga mediterraneensis]
MIAIVEMIDSMLATGLEPVAVLNAIREFATRVREEQRARSAERQRKSRERRRSRAGVTVTPCPSFDKKESPPPAPPLKEKINSIPVPEREDEQARPVLSQPELTPAMRDDARSLGYLDEQIEREWQALRDWAANHGTPRDWAARWRRWLGSPRASAPEGLAATRGEMRKRLRAMVEKGFRSGGGRALAELDIEPFLDRLYGPRDDDSLRNPDLVGSRVAFETPKPSWHDFTATGPGPSQSNPPKQPERERDPMDPTREPQPVPGNIPNSVFRFAEKLKMDKGAMVDLWRTFKDAAKAEGRMSIHWLAEFEAYVTSAMCAA